MQIIHLDLAKGTAGSSVSGAQLREEHTVYAKQGDVGRKFTVVLTDGGIEYPVEQGACLTLWYSGTSGQGNYASIGEHSAFTVDGNHVTVELITQMLQNPGGGMMCLVLHNAQGDQIGLWNMRYIVEAVPGLGSAEASENYTALSSLVAQALEAAQTFETDSSFSEVGKAADAAAVGDALEGKADAGYGYGDQLLALGIDQIDEILDGMGNCSVKQVVFTDTTTEIFSNYGVATLYKYINGYASMRAMNHDGFTAIRKMVNGVWSEWEYENPPMSFGTVYRTTRRWKEKPVYTVLVSLGGWTDNKTVTVNLGYVAQAIQWSGTISGYCLPRHDPTNSSDVTNASLRVEPSATGLGITMCGGTSTFPGLAAYAQIWYVKQ